MYSPTTRVLTVLELLQSHYAISGSELARRLEVDRRTVRRYITMLQDMGIPVEAEHGRYGAYRLRRGYKLPPLMFNEPEAIALTLGLLAMREFRFPVDVAAVEGALAKAERVMPEQLLHQARALQEAIVLNISFPHARLQNEYLRLLSSAARERRQVRMRYRARRGDESERSFDPYGIVFNEGYWYSAGYCHLRQDLRTFRLDRIVTLAPGEERFERPDEFDVLGCVLSAITAMPGPYQVEVVLETSLEHAQQAISADMGTLEPMEQGVVFRRTTEYFEWVAYFLMDLDFPVRVIAPEVLRDMLRQFGMRALRMAGNTG